MYMGNSPSCTNAKNDNLTGIQLNEGIDIDTGDIKSIFTFPSYTGCNGIRTLEIIMSKDGQKLKVTNKGSNTNVIGLNNVSEISTTYTKNVNSEIKEKFSASESSDKNICLSYNIVISLIIILLIVFYLNYSKS